MVGSRPREESSWFHSVGGEKMHVDFPLFVRPLHTNWASLVAHSGGKESACSAGDLGSVPGLGRSPGEGNSYPLQYSGLENSMGSQRLGHT